MDRPHTRGCSFGESRRESSQRIALSIVRGLVLLLAGGPALWAALPASQEAQSQEVENQEAQSPPAQGSQPRQAEPPDGVWLEDEQGQYYLLQYPKEEGTYRWLDREKGLLRFRNSPMVKIDHEDDEFFYVRVNKLEPRPSPKEGPSAQELEAMEASYPGTPPQQDLLEMRPFEQGLPNSGQWRNGFVVEDMNGDGHLDIVHGAARKSGSSPVIALGDSQGNWRRWEAMSLPELPFDYGDVAVADFNLDGHLDVVYAIHLRGFIALAGDGKGGFTDMSEGLPMQGVAGRKTRAFTSRAIVAADWNGDGRPDLLALSEGPASAEQMAEGVEALRGKAAFLSEAEGSWSAISSDPGDDAMGDHLAVGDLNGDGRLDFVTDVRISGRKDLVNIQTSAGRWERRELEALRPTSTAWAVEVHDLDGDGDLDLAVAYRSFEIGGARDGIDLFYNDGSAGFERQGLVSTKDNVAYTEVGAGDVDGNGYPDLVALDAQGQARLYLQRAAGEFVEEVSPELLPDERHRYCVGYRARLVDLNRDGRSELLANFAGEPGSEAVFGEFERCQARGAIRVWTASSTEGEAEDSESPGS